MIFNWNLWCAINVCLKRYFLHFFHLNFSGQVYSTRAQTRIEKNKFKTLRSNTSIAKRVQGQNIDFQPGLVPLTSLDLGLHMKIWMATSRVFSKISLTKSYLVILRVLIPLLNSLAHELGCSSGILYPLS